MAMVDSHGRADALGRLRLVGLVAPVVFVALAVAATPLVIRAFGFHVGLALMGSALTLAAIGFGTGMFWLLDRAHQTVVETERTSAALTERERIARELHDSLAQVLGVTHLRLAALAARPSLKADPPPRPPPLRSTSSWSPN